MLDFGIFYGHLVYLMAIDIFLAIWYILWYFGLFFPMYQEKSGNPVSAHEKFSPKGF
jgi:hypothetical protein